MHAETEAARSAADVWAEYLKIHGRVSGAVAVDRQTREVVTGPDALAVLAAAGDGAADRLVFVQLGAADVRRRPFRVRGRWHKVD